ncbi:hypothetical protein ACJQWK_01618 [Exserohilum turcicum]|uniref:Uncharacterized protein n=1 Tax=Exserohilum turcicum (strain 28A) TaxID=671987 RepID=R0IV81_EXST2|nr:uncharacterized protein SETTUDRAFT_27471 [Exserohilum turcica Et28A]EOA88665.1 hypothetical protein SETTUDRAFT_27471 [Exserohilum turcica Et28A]
MKLTTIILGAMATIAMGSPVAVSQDESPATNMAAVDTASIAAYCKQCDAFFTKCMGSIGCWYNPYGCSITCGVDTCRAYNGDCKRNCNYNKC